MVGILVISHGNLAEALISSAEFIVGNLDRIRGVPVWPKDQEKEVKDRIQKKLTEVDDGEGIVILTDVLVAPLLTSASPVLKMKRLKL